MAHKQVFQDEGAQWYWLTGLCLVACPDCGCQATVDKLPESVYRFVCPLCVRRRETKVTSFSTQPTGNDPWFGYLLWLQVPIAAKPCGPSTPNT